MERYFFLIFDDLSTGEKSYLLNYFGEEIIFGGHQLYHSTYIYILNLKKRWKKHIEWKKINAAQDIVQLILKSCDNIDDTKSEDVYDCCPMAECINILADLLPAPGTFVLDVIASSKIFENLSVSDHVELAASLHRLSEWHSAHTCWLTALNTDNCSNLREWLDLTHAEAVDISKPSQLSLPFWRGVVEFQDPNASTQCYKGFELRVDSENSDQMHLCLNSIFNMSDASEYLLLHPVLKATEICSFSSISQHLLLPFAFKLYVLNNSCYNSSLKLFVNIKEKNDVALILRMGYSKLNDKPQSDKVLNTNRWIRIVSSGNVKFPESCLPDVNKQLTLAVVASKNSDDVLAFVIRDTSLLDAQFYFSAVSIQNKQCFSPLRNGSTRVERKTFSVPFVSEALFLSSLQETKSLHAVSSESGVCEDISTNDLLTSFIQCIGKAEPVNYKDFGNVNAVYDEIDPSDWAERIHLLQRQISLDEERKNKRNVFMSFSPKRSRYYVSFSSDDIRKYFEPSGEAKDSKRAESIQSLGYNMNFNKDSLETIKEKEWPEILSCFYDDIYYNATKQSEENESIGNEMVKCYVHHETASTCNNNQSQPDAPITIQARSMTPRKRPSSSSKLGTSSFRQAFMRPGAGTKERFLRSAEGQSSNPVISTIMKTLGVSEPSSDAASRAHKNPRKNSLPVRCSPRKKCSVDYYSSSKSHNSTNKVQKNRTIKGKSNDDLPEILKKKLRSSIAIALESNGINIEDALFKPCFKRLFTICQVFVQDIQDNPRKLGTSQYIQEIAEEHVKPVIKFEKQKRK